MKPQLDGGRTRKVIPVDDVNLNKIYLFFKQAIMKMMYHFASSWFGTGNAYLMLPIYQILCRGNDPWFFTSKCSESCEPTLTRTCNNFSFLNCGHCFVVVRVLEQLPRF